MDRVADTARAAEVTGASEGLELFRRMLLIRRFEDLVQSMFLEGAVHGTTHLCSGQEASPVGVASVLGEGDRVAGTYRGHGVALALGVEPQALLDELLGKASGVCAGRAGSMNVVDLKHRLIGCFGIVGGSIGAATGAALALREHDGVAVAFFGDGAANQGYFHECLNLAKVMTLPVVYVCENNLYGEFTPWQQVTAGEIRSRPETFGIESVTIDGNDVWTVQETARRAVESARAGNGPQFIESMTYRFVGHSRSDPGRYRPAGELDAWRERDPLKRAETVLTDRFEVDAAAIEVTQASVEQQIALLAERGRAAPFPDAAAPVTEFKA
jgi:acetoin:2,6-dichlorophenolindophenol oxidoreductase subunit alpha